MQTPMLPLLSTCDLSVAQVLFRRQSIFGETVL